MNGAILVRRNSEGVLLRYDVGARRPYQDERRQHVSDRRRSALIAAEHELIVIEIVAEHLDISVIGLTRIYDALRIIRCALESKRPGLGLQRSRLEV